MLRRPPKSTPTDTLFPYTTLFRARAGGLIGAPAAGWGERVRHLGGEGGAGAERGERQEEAVQGHAKSLGVSVTGVPAFRTRVRLPAPRRRVRGPPSSGRRMARSKIGRASCRERVCQYV